MRICSKAPALRLMSCERFNTVAKNRFDDLCQLFDKAADDYATAQRSGNRLARLYASDRLIEIAQKMDALRTAQCNDDAGY